MSIINNIFPLPLGGTALNNNIQLLFTDIVNQVNSHIAATIASGTTNRLAYYTSSTAIGALSAITASKALQSNASGLPEASSVTTTELGYLSGVTSAIQTQFSGKASTALSNLASVAINTTLVSDTNNTDDLGTTGINWKNLYLSGSIFTGSTEALTLTASLLTVPVADFSVTRSAAANINLTVENTSNASTSAQSRIFVRVGGSSAGDAYTQWGINGVLDFTAGIDNSDSDAWVLSGSSTLGTNNAIRVDATTYAVATSNGLLTSTINGTGVWGFRNRIINGDMRIDQRNVGAALTVNANADFFHADRWHSVGENADGVFTIQQVSATPPTFFTHYTRVTVTTADASIGATQRYFMEQRVEGTNIKDFSFGSANAKNIVLSFYVRSSVTGTFSGAIVNSADNRSYPYTYDISSANTWEFKTISIAGDTTGTWLTTTGVGFRCYFDIGSGTDRRGTANTWGTTNAVGATGATSLIATLNATWDITGVQLEIGSIASNFEFRPEAIELQLCQRYFEKTFDYDVAVTQNSGSQLGALSYRVAIAGVLNQSVMWYFKVQKRSSPTITFYNTAATNSNWRNHNDNADSGASGAEAVGMSAVMARNAQAAGDGAGETVRIHATASAEL